MTRKDIIAIIAGCTIGATLSFMGYSFTTWQFWVFILINIIALDA